LIGLLLSHRVFSLNLPDFREFLRDADVFQKVWQVRPRIIAIARRGHRQQACDAAFTPEAPRLRLGLAAIESLVAPAVAHDRSNRWSLLIGRSTTQLFGDWFFQKRLFKKTRQCEPSFAVTRGGATDTLGFDVEVGQMKKVLTCLLKAGRTGSGVDHFLFHAWADGGFDTESQFSELREKKTGDIAGKSNLW